MSGDNNFSNMVPWMKLGHLKRQPEIASIDSHKAWNIVQVALDNQCSNSVIMTMNVIWIFVQGCVQESSSCPFLCSHQLRFICVLSLFSAIIKISHRLQDHSIWSLLVQKTGGSLLLFLETEVPMQTKLVWFRDWWICCCSTELEKTVLKLSEHTHAWAQREVWSDAFVQTYPFSVCGFVFVLKLTPFILCKWKDLSLWHIPKAIKEGNKWWFFCEVFCILCFLVATLPVILCRSILVCQFLVLFQWHKKAPWDLFSFCSWWP